MMKYALIYYGMGLEVREAQEEGVYIIMSNVCYTAESNTTL